MNNKKETHLVPRRHVKHRLGPFPSPSVCPGVLVIVVVVVVVVVVMIWWSSSSSDGGGAVVVEL